MAPSKKRTPKIVMLNYLKQDMGGFDRTHMFLSHIFDYSNS